jgi:cyanophycinase
VLDAIWDLYRRGGVIAGTSAGAAVMSSTMFYDAKPVLAMLQQGVSDGRDIAPGLGFIGDDIFVDQHLLIRGRFARMLPVMLAKGYQLGLGVDENTAVVIKPDREAEVIGYKGVLLVDLGQATTERKQNAFNISNASISYLDKGDKFRLDTRVFLPSSDKIEGKLDPADPSYREPLYSADILGNTTLVDLMEKLIDSDQRQAIGLAFEGPRDDPHPNPIGFEFRFSRSPDSVGYSSASSAAYSIYRVRLDVRPIVLGWPSYKYH